MSFILIKNLIKKGGHIGHKIQQWNSSMLPYVYTQKNGICIIDLIQTIICYHKTCIFLQNKAAEGQNFLFIGTRKEMQSIVENTAKKSNSFYINKKWQGGLLTNWTTIQENIFFFSNNEQKMSTKVTDRNKLIYKKRTFDKYYGGIKKMRSLPHIVIMTDQKSNLGAIKECNRLKIPVVCLLDSNSYSDVIDFPIPTNDDSVQIISFFFTQFTEAIIAGRNLRKKK
uniref:Small ribosomal subunit protein uS2c n=1 Tax=Pterocladiophila hemisphaerica TaxID=2712948 RepID=A0A6M3WW56_9FLOR|nr:ribosomal protein S2 [Pterocladiophila hemisphaerica]